MNRGEQNMDIVEGADHELELDYASSSRVNYEERPNLRSRVEETPRGDDAESEQVVATVMSET